MELATPGSAVRHVFVVGHIIDCAKLPGIFDCLWSATQSGKKSNFGPDVYNQSRLWRDCKGAHAHLGHCLLLSVISTNFIMGGKYNQSSRTDLPGLKLRVLLSYLILV